MKYLPALLALSFVVSHTPAKAQGLLDSLMGAGQTILQQQMGAGSANTSGLAENDIVAGLKQALEIATSNVVTQVSATNGYNGDPAIRIPLPAELQTVNNALGAIGMGSLGDTLETRMNTAAEEAAPKARQIFLDALAQMTIQDARAILEGTETSATDYFRRTSSNALGAEIRPVIERSLADVGALALYDQFMGQYKTLPFVPDVKSDVVTHTTDLAVQGIFHHIANEEVAIRRDPARRTTDLLQQVFGGS